MPLAVPMAVLLGVPSGVSRHGQAASGVRRGRQAADGSAQGQSPLASATYFSSFSNFQTGG